MKNGHEATKVKLFTLFVHYNINIGHIVPDPE